MILVSTLQFDATQRCQAVERFNVRRNGGLTNPLPGCKSTVSHKSSLTAIKKGLEPKKYERQTKYLSYNTFGSKPLP